MLTHFLIKDGRITGYNGRVAISTRTATDRTFVVSPKASPLIKAVAQADGPISLSVDNGRLYFASGGFRVFIDTVPVEDFTLPTLGAHKVELPPGFRKCLEELKPFVGVDSSRNWACGIYFDGECAYASNNVIAVQYWLGCDFGEPFNLPDVAINELLRIQDSPTSLAVTEGGVTFYYADGTWLHTTRYASGWPDIHALMNGIHETADQWVTLPNGFFDAVKRLKYFVEEVGSVYLTPEGLSTSDQPDKAGASVALSGLPEGRSIFHFDQLLKLEGSVSSLALSCYPLPVPFVNEAQNMRGAIVGLRL